MSYYGEDFYYEPSEFDIMVNEFKQVLMKSVKEEYINEMEELRKENAELQEVKKNLQQIKNDYDRKAREISLERANLESKIRRERLSSLIKEVEVEYYSVASKGKAKTKCDKCDDNRRIYFKTPSGRETYESCECSQRIQVYEPVSTILSTFSFRNGNASAWYKINIDGSDEWLTHYDDSISGNELITDERQFEDIGYSYKALFPTKELAQKYCDYKNEKNI